MFIDCQNSHIDTNFRFGRSNVATNSKCVFRNTEIVERKLKQLPMKYVGGFVDNAMNSKVYRDLDNFQEISFT